MFFFYIKIDKNYISEKIFVNIKYINFLVIKQERQKKIIIYTNM